MDPVKVCNVMKRFQAFLNKTMEISSRNWDCRKILFTETLDDFEAIQRSLAKIDLLSETVGNK